MGIAEEAMIMVRALEPVDGIAMIDTLNGVLRTSGTGEIKVSGINLKTTNRVGFGKITVWAKVNDGAATMETLDVSVEEPTGVRFIEFKPWRNTTIPQ
jgi:hypothetical protein